MPKVEVECKSKKTLIELHNQPISNRYAESPDSSSVNYNFSLNVNTETGLVFLTSDIDASELTPRLDWITYAEPEPHLDDMVDSIINFTDLDGHAKVAGLTFKDASTLQRFHHKGFDTLQITNSDLGIDEFAGIESIQSALTIDLIDQLKQKYGRPDILIVRHILEHAYDIKLFLSALKSFVSEKGTIVFEVPDCTNSLASFDYTMIWEEHIYYFTPDTLKQTLKDNGYRVDYLHSYPYILENSLVCFASANGDNAHKDALRKPDAEVCRAVDYGKRYTLVKDAVYSHLTYIKKNHGDVLLFGAGHLACAFIHFFGLKSCISAVIDDDENKQNLFMPGTDIPIQSSQRLNSKNFGICLLCINPLNETALIDKLIKNGVERNQLSSIFPNSPYTIFKDL